MTDSNRSFTEVVTLLEERQRYVTWLEALDARRESTPTHVFERVQADYRSRLERVDEQIESHRHAIEEERASVQSRLSLLQAEERTRRDERAELELRAHVGELAGADADAAFHSVDDALAQLTTEKTSLESRIVELEGLLEPRVTPPRTATPVESEASIPDANVGTDSGENGDVIPIESVAEETAPEPRVEQHAAAAAPTQTAEDELAALRTPSGSFDELAFLHTVVGDEDVGGAHSSDAPLIGHSRRDSSIVRDEPSTDSLLAGLGNTPPQAAANVPLARNVPANTPIVLKSTSSVEQVKTLKCSECGAMNYPTEWYCERCGAELAAL